MDADDDDEDDEGPKVTPKAKKETKSDPIEALMKEEPELAAQIRELVKKKDRKVSDKGKWPDISSTFSGVIGKKNKKNLRRDKKERERRERKKNKGKATAKEAVIGTIDIFRDRRKNPSQGSSAETSSSGSSSSGSSSSKEGNPIQCFGGVNAARDRDRLSADLRTEEANLVSMVRNIYSNSALGPRREMYSIPGNKLLPVEPGGLRNNLEQGKTFL